MYLIVETVSIISLMENKTSTLTTCIAYILKVLANAIKQEKDIKGRQFGKTKLNLSTFTDEIIK